MQHKMEVKQLVFRAALVMGAVSIAPFFASGEEVSAQTEAKESEDIIELEPMIVTAWRFDEDSFKIPASVMVIDSNTIRERAASSVADMLSDVGVLMRSYTGNPAQSQIDMRGYGESGNLNILVLVDGRRINAPDMSGINWLNMPLASVDRIEVLRGSQSALYGNNAGGGVIKITTIIPDSPGGAALAGGGSWDTYVFRAAGWTPITDNIRARTEIGYIESDGYRDNSGYKTRVANTSIQGGKGNFTWTATAGIDDNYFEYPGPLDNETYKSDPRKSGYYPYESDYNGESTSEYVGGSAAWKGDSLELLADLNGSKRDLSWDMGGSGMDAESTLNTWTFSPRARYEWNDGFSAVLGTDGEYDNLFLERFPDLGHTDKIAHAKLKRQTGGIYANGSWTNKGDRPVTIDAVARLQAHDLDAYVIDDTGKKPKDANSKSGNDSAFSLGAAWQAAKSLRLWTRGDRFFRYPAIDEVVAYQGYDLRVPFNSNLESERGWSGELGADWALPHVVVKLDAFVQDVDGLIAFDYDDNMNVNLADAVRAGFETSVVATIGDWRFGIFHTMTRVRFSDGMYEDKELYLVPLHQLNGYVEWNPGRLSLRAGGRFVDKCWQGNDFRNEKDKMPDYFVLDLMARYRIGTQWHIFAAVDNALDRKYSTLRYSGVWYPASSIGYRFGVQWEY
jgi:iron complex outermembrane recepter protein